MEKNLFEKFLFEAPEDAPPDVQPATESPPDVPTEAPADDPPDISDGAEDIPADDAPPDLPDGGDDGFGDTSEFDDPGSEEVDGGEPNNFGLDEKISAIMNMQLYQRFLSLLNTIAGQLTLMKNNSDVLYTLSPNSLDNTDALKKLDENVRLYLKNSFLNENYSKNLLFFNKVINLLKLLNDVFDKNIKKGINSM